MDGAVPGCPKLYFGVVDVRDVADLHLRAMTDPAAKGERFLAVSATSSRSLRDRADLEGAGWAPRQARADARDCPNWLVRLAAMRDPTVKQILPELGKRKNATNEKARRVLQWAPRSAEEAIASTGESLVRYGLLKDSRKH